MMKVLLISVVLVMTVLFSSVSMACCVCMTC